ncbi:MAG: glycoside hydrolase domain-containing protein [Candidatus Ratteibacteria bacterium]
MGFFKKLIFTICVFIFQPFIKNCTGLDLSNVVFHISFKNGYIADINRDNKNEPVEIYGKPEVLDFQGKKVLKIRNGIDYLKYSINKNLKSGAISFLFSPAPWNKEGQGNWDGSMSDVLQVFFHTGKDNQQIVIQQLWPRRSIFFLLYNNNSPIGGFPACLTPSVPFLTSTDAEGFIKPGKWYHALFTWQNGKITAYLNGKFMSEYKTPEIKLDTIIKNIYIGWNRKEANCFIDPGCENQAKPISEKPWETLIGNITIFDQYIFPQQAEKIYQYGDIDYARRAEPNPISIEPKFYPTYEKLKITITAPGNEEKKGRIFIKDAIENTVKEVNFTLSPDEDVKTINVILPNLKDGLYYVYGTLEKNNKVIFETDKKSFEKKTFEWMNNKLGIEDVVLPPWTPIKLNKNIEDYKVEVWGRIYTFSNSNIFPVSIISQNEEILADSIVISIDGTIPAWKKLNFSEISSTRCVFSNKGDTTNYKIESRGKIEFDGFLWYEVNFISKNKGNGEEIDNLKIDIPLKKDICLFFQYPYSRSYWFPNKYWNSGFLPYIWIGNDNLGLQWFAESNQYWYSKEPSKTIEIIPEGTYNILRINIVRDKIEMPEEFKICFGFIATPVKPLPENWRSWNFASWDLPWRQGEPEKYFNLNMDYGWWSIAPAWLIPKWEKSEYKINKPQMWIPFTSNRFLGIRRYDAQSKFDFLPEWKIFSHEWSVIPEQINYGTAPGWNEAQINPSKSYCDFFVYHVNEFFKNYDVDGLYFDGYAGPTPSANIDVGFGYIDRDGNIKPVYPILAGRELMKRIYTIVKKYRPEKGVIIVYPATFIAMPVLSFTDGNYEGEHWIWADLADKIKKGGGWYSAALTPDWLRVVHNMKPFGLVPNFDCRLYLAWDSDQPHKHAREFFGLLLTHDIHSWGGWTGGYARTFGITLDWWGITDKDVKFLPYWEKEPAFKVSLNPEGTKEWDSCFASGWINYKKKKMLIVAMNLSKYWLSSHRYEKEGDIGYYLNINLKKLGIENKKILVTDAESLGKLNLPFKDGQVPLTVEPHGVRLISITWE